MNTAAFLIFVIDEQRYALSVEAVRNVLRAAAVTRLSDAPELLLGLLNIGGTFIPVINIREQLGLTQKEIQVSDRIILADAPPYTVAFMADAVEDVVVLETAPLDASVDIFPGMEKFLAGISSYNGHTVLIYDIETLFPENTIRTIADMFEQIEGPA